MDGRRRSLSGTIARVDTNLSLWLDRFLGTQKPGKEDALTAYNERRNHFRTIRSDVGYAAAIHRREQCLRDLNGGFESGTTHVFTAEVLGRLAVGLGQASVWENNVALSRTWGTPVIPGSALKGLVSSYASRNGDEHWLKPGNVAEPKGESQRLLFGDVDDAGEVTFHDAWWIPVDKPMVDPDVMTVHHGDYYSGKAAAPADWDEPNPVAFFTASGSFLVAISGPLDALEVTADLLHKALEEDGLGAKTHAGYGRMKLTRKLTQEEIRAQQEREAELRQLAERSRILQGLSVPISPAQAGSEIPLRLEKLFTGDYSETEQREVIFRLIKSNKDALHNWQKKDPSRLGASFVLEQLDAVRAASAPTPAQIKPGKDVPEIIRRETQATLRIKGKDVFIDSLGEAIPYRGGQKSHNLVVNSGDTTRGLAFLKDLLAKGNGTYTVPVTVNMDGDKIKTLEFLLPEPLK